MDFILIRITVFFIAMAIGFLPLIFYFYKEGFKNIKSKNIFFVYVVFIAFCTVYELVFSSWLHINVIPFRIFYALADFLLLFFIISVQVRNTNKRLMNAIMIVYLLLYTYFVIHVKTIDFMVSDGYLSIIIIFMLLYGFIRWLIDQFNNPLLEKLTQAPFFWFISGVLIFYVPGVMLYILTEPLVLSEYSFGTLHIFNNIGLIIFRIFVSIAIWKGLVK